MLNFAVTAAGRRRAAHRRRARRPRVLDAVTAPSFEPAAVAMLSRKGDKCRFLANEALGSPRRRLTRCDAHAAPGPRRYLRQPNDTGCPISPRPMSRASASERCAEARPDPCLGDLRHLQSTPSPSPAMAACSGTAWASRTASAAASRPSSAPPTPAMSGRGGCRERQLLPAVRTGRRPDRRRHQRHLGNVWFGARRGHR